MAQLITNRVRDFRKNRTLSENRLWQMLRNRKLDMLPPLLERHKEPASKGEGSG
jgi:hypothetical protein